MRIPSILLALLAILAPLCVFADDAAQELGVHHVGRSLNTASMRQLRRSSRLSNQARSATGEAASAQATAAFGSSPAAGNAAAAPSANAGGTGGAAPAGGAIGGAAGVPLTSGDESDPEAGQPATVAGHNATPWQDFMNLAQRALMAAGALMLISSLCSKHAKVLAASVGGAAAAIPWYHAAMYLAYLASGLGALAGMLGCVIMGMGQTLQGGILTGLGALTAVLALRAAQGDSSTADTLKSKLGTPGTGVTPAPPAAASPAPATASAASPATVEPAPATAASVSAAPAPSNGLGFDPNNPFGQNSFLNPDKPFDFLNPSGTPTPANFVETSPSMVPDASVVNQAAVAPVSNGTLYTDNLGHYFTTPSPDIPGEVVNVQATVTSVETVSPSLPTELIPEG